MLGQQQHPVVLLFAALLNFNKDIECGGKFPFGSFSIVSLFSTKMPSNVLYFNSFIKYTASTASPASPAFTDKRYSFTHTHREKNIINLISSLIFDENCLEIKKLFTGRSDTLEIQG